MEQIIFEPKNQEQLEFLKMAGKALKIDFEVFPRYDTPDKISISVPGGDNYWRTYFSTRAINVLIPFVDAYCRKKVGWNEDLNWRSPQFKQIQEAFHSLYESVALNEVGMILSRQKIRGSRNCGKKTLREISSVLEKHGLKLKP